MRQRYGNLPLELMRVTHANILSINHQQKDNMSEEPGAVTGAVKKRTRNTEAGKAITFVYADSEGKILSGHHNTKAFSVEEAWKEFSAKQNINDTSVMKLAFPTHVTAMANKIRKHTRDELLKIAGLED